MKKTSLSGAAIKPLLDRVPRSALIGCMVVVLGLGAWLLANQLLSNGPDSTQSAWNDAYQHQADDLAAAVVAALEPYQAAVRSLATNAAVRDVLRTGDLAARSSLAAQLTPTLDDVQLLRLLPADVRDPELDASPPLSYASISMLNSARESGEAPPAEVHLAGSEQEHIVILARVEDAAASDGTPELLGFVHLSIHPDIVRRVLTDHPQPGIFAEIFQGPHLSLASTGTKPSGEVPSAIARVAGSSIAVRLKARGSAPAQADEGSAWLIPVIAIALLALMIGVVLRMQRPALRVTVTDSGRIYAGAIKAIYDGAHPGLAQLMPGATRSPGTIDAEIFQARAEGDDITAFDVTGAGAAGEDPTVPRADDDIAQATAPAEEAVAEGVPASIFRSYDIRGIVGETLTENGVYQIGRALGAEAEARGQRTVVVARDGRHSSAALLSALTSGLLESGRDVLDIGETPTPVLYFATHYLDARSGVMITGSHNPAQYNGLKIVLDGETLSGDAIQAIRRRIEEQDFVDGTGSLQTTDIIAEYIRRVSEDIPVTLGGAMKVVVDCGNAVPGAVAPDILRAIGHDVVELFCEIDGDFPNHHPDPSQPENLEALINAVIDEGADLGLAFDGDGDRLGVIDAEGNVIWPDRQMILFARDILSRNPGAKIIYDVKCSRRLAEDIRAHGGEPIMARSGHSLIKAKMQETGALLAGEMSGHIFFKERWYGFDDALYAAARLLEILVNSEQSPADLFAALPGGVATPELHLDMPESAHADFMAQVLAQAQFEDGEITTIDGLRVDFADSWGLVRPSNTTPCLVLRFEGDDTAALTKVMERFRTLLREVEPGLELPF